MKRRRRLKRKTPHDEAIQGDSDEPHDEVLGMAPEAPIDPLDPPEDLDVVMGEEVVIDLPVDDASGDAEHTAKGDAAEATSGDDEADAQETADPTTITDASSPEASEVAPEAPPEAEDAAEPDDAVPDGPADRLAQLAAHVGDLRQLSEALSIRYNPFLDDTDDVHFDGRSIQDFLPNGLDVPPGPARPALKMAGAEIVRPVAGSADFEAAPIDEGLPPHDSSTPPEEPMSSDARDARNRPPRPTRNKPADVEEDAESAMVVAPAIDAKVDAVLEEAERPAPREPPMQPPALPPAPVEETVPEAADPEPADPEPTDPEPLLPTPAPAPPRPAAPARPAAPRLPQPRPMGRPVNPRETAAVLRWFERMLDHAPGPATFLFIDHYRELGWLDADQHAWLTRLAHGIAKPRNAATWTTFKLEPVKLLRIHAANLRFFDRLWRAPDVRDARAIERSVDRLMELD